MAHARPSPAGGLTDPYTGVLETAPPVVRVELPFGRIPLILNRGAPATVAELAAPFAMSLPAVSKHLSVLERAELIERGRAVGDDLTITRFFADPRAVVFRAFGEGGWWGGDGFTCTAAEVNPVVGGAWSGRIRNEQDGTEYGFHGVHREIVTPERLVYRFIWDDPGAGNEDHVSVITVNFDEVDGGTLMTFHQTPFISAQSRDSHGQGWSQALDNLSRMLDAR